mmetsp:Transcript_4184/g.11536  ORF Transcript_4184/g.11536 Transcript_4184/m.11536 type:complete len:243 (-) Transcript_4184:3385-4113(-)
MILSYDDPCCFVSFVRCVPCSDSCSCSCYGSFLPSSCPIHHHFLYLLLHGSEGGSNCGSCYSFCVASQHYQPQPHYSCGLCLLTDEMAILFHNFCSCCDFDSGYDCIVTTWTTSKPSPHQSSCCYHHVSRCFDSRGPFHCLFRYPYRAYLYLCHDLYFYCNFGIDSGYNFSHGNLCAPCCDNDFHGDGPLYPRRTREKGSDWRTCHDCSSFGYGVVHHHGCHVLGCAYHIETQNHEGPSFQR